MVTHWIRGGLAAALISGAALAQAQTVTLTGWTFGTGNNVGVTAPGGIADSGPAGGFTGSLSGFGAPFDTASFATYCVDLVHTINLPSTMTGYTLISAAADNGSFASGGWGANAATVGANLGKLMTYVQLNPSAVSTSAASTALQLAIWNTIYDTDSTVFSGAFSVGTSTYSVYGAAADALIAASASVTSDLYVYVAKSSTNQALLVTTAVPEPSNYALMLAGLAGIGFVARRRVRR